MDPRQLADSFFSKLSEQLPEGANKMGEDLREQMRRAAMATFKELQLVTRDEFDQQNQQLSRLSTQLERLEKQLDDINKN